MFGVISSYRELTGFQPVELTDITLPQQVYCPLTPRTAGALTSASKARSTPINSQQAKLAKLKLTIEDENYNVDYYSLQCGTAGPDVIGKGYRFVA